MFPGGNGHDYVIIVVARISDLYSISGCGISNVVDPASGPALIPLPRYNNEGVLATPFLVTANLFEVV